MNAQCFTHPFPGLVRELTSSCFIRPAFNPSQFKSPKEYPEGKKYVALWDTGATGSVITRRVAEELGLHVISYTSVNHALGKTDGVPVYRINIELPNNVGFSDIIVTEGVLAKADVLIGMDVINKGDFAISNYGGHTTFSFRVPSIEEANLTPPPQQPVVKDKKPGRNELCFCGSGKKYKNCHGKV